MERYICIHGHFYQPPRENPWLEAIELQDSAAPYHDWNERITAECYAPNSVSRILDGQNRIVKLFNNYARMSFNIGPTLLSWMEDHEPDVYAAILSADQESQKKFSGHGSALAQAYNHMIMPLAGRRDRATQIVWGIRDFEKRFKRVPEGMWLPETAVDVDTLELLAERGIRFTILAPHQAARVRPIGSRDWRDLHDASIDPSRAYQQRLPSGRTIALFFYDGPTARAVAFEGLLSRGERLIEKLTGSFSSERNWPQLVHIATDGESYGHHHKFGDMALAYALDQIDTRKLARLTNYGEYLEKQPPTHEVEIVQQSSWSCSHGIERWRSNCGCNSGGRPGWHQEWRAPLRDALDHLRDTVAPQWEKKALTFFKEPWAARDAYIDVVLDRSPENLKKFFTKQALRRLTNDETTVALKLLELQRHAMLMYTSCGWFFDEISGIETVQILQYAGRAAQLAQELFGDSLEANFVKRLTAAKSNLPELGDGAQIYDRHVLPAKVDLEKLGAHYAVCTLFENLAREENIYCYSSVLEDRQVFAAGRVQLVFGRVNLTSSITLDTQRLTFGVLYLGDHNINGGVGQFIDNDSYQKVIGEALKPFRRADFANVLRVMDRCFGESNYSIQSLFRDQQRAILDTILAANLTEAVALYRQIYEQRAPLMRFLTKLEIPLPKAFSAAAEFVLNSALRSVFESELVDTSRVHNLLETAKDEGVALDSATLEFDFRRSLERLAAQFAAKPTLANLERLTNAASLLPSLPCRVSLWKVQNIYYQMLTSVFPDKQKHQERDKASANSWLRSFEDLGHMLSVKTP